MGCDIVIDFKFPFLKINGGHKMITKFFKKITGIQAIEDATNKATAIQQKKFVEATERIAHLSDTAQKEAEARAKAAIELEKAIAELTESTKIAKEAEADAKRTPKERATAKGEPYVTVLETHVAKDNIRNGFFELDWNDEFVVQLKAAGYGFDGDEDEGIVDRWFKDLARNMLVEEGQDPTVSAGYINVSKLGNGKASVE
jgi:hypothetical protein